MPDQIPHKAWDEFKPAFRWRQGEHVSLIGPNGSGKTTLALDILDRREWVIVLGSKPRDRVLESLKKEGYKKISTWNPPAHEQRLLLWPPFGKPEDMQLQSAVFNHAIREIFASGGWCIYADELRYLCETLRLQKLFELLWLQGRALGISLVAGAQRPAFVPTLLYDQAVHLFFWRDNDELNLKRIGGIGWINSRTVRECVAQLPFHHVLYLNTRTGKMLTTKVEV